MTSLSPQERKSDAARRVVEYATNFLRAYTDYFDGYGCDTLRQVSDLGLRQELLPLYGRNVGGDIGLAALYTNFDFYLYFLNADDTGLRNLIDASKDSGFNQDWTLHAPGARRGSDVLAALGIDRSEIIPIAAHVSMINVPGTNFVGSRVDVVAAAIDHGNNFAQQASQHVQTKLPHIIQKYLRDEQLQSFADRYQWLAESSGTRQTIGQQFEVLWRDVLTSYGWAPRKTRIPGEENDFTAMYRGLHVLGEVRWYKDPITGGKLREFLGKLNTRPMTVGLMISHSGIDDGATRVLQRSLGSNPAVVFAREHIDAVLRDKADPGPMFESLLRDANDFLHERPS